ncbi:uncharacterized protein BJ171DRAFT_601121 [Polychytrium aggregatum]|uniref:uncharacterized protein n=1 Tax=Polychytrium aggregatum TaxID=110093 RepID=UPI0022FE44E5|nr:uncharacterized protein BJ171DRAFT_601121 [Polychytrium aggregatum]KAI9202194.1 hypothetical protein BJ171DRAFT_601121 [Polychytrium aggregatum]
MSAATQPRSTQSSASKRAEQAFERLVKEENRLSHQKEADRRQRVIAFVAKWQDNAMMISWKSDIRRLQEETREEIMLANKEMIDLRRAELRELLERDREDYLKELDTLKLSFHHDRI